MKASMSPSTLFRKLARYAVARPVRNFIRAPRQSTQWLVDETSFKLGRVGTCEVRNGWTVKCHPASMSTFRAHRDIPEFIDEIDGFIEQCRPGMHFIDVGAHYGVFSLAASHFGGKTARVLAVDPNQSSNRILRINLALAGFDRVKLIEAAVGAEDGTLPMLTTGAAGGNFMVAADEARPDTAMVPQFTIPTLARDNDLVPTHLKIDVEGFEGEVLAGGRELLQRSRPALFLELHSSILRSRGRDPKDILDGLFDVGYSHISWRGRKVNAEEIAAKDIARIVIT
jgi:FkbM family methyltransferase